MDDRGRFSDDVESGTGSCDWQHASRYGWRPLPVRHYQHHPNNHHGGKRTTTHNFPYYATVVPGVITQAQRSSGKGFGSNLGAALGALTGTIVLVILILLFCGPGAPQNSRARSRSRTRSGRSRSSNTRRPPPVPPLAGQEFGLDVGHPSRTNGNENEAPETQPRAAFTENANRPLLLDSAEHEPVTANMAVPRVSGPGPILQTPGAMEQVVNNNQALRLSPQVQHQQTPMINDPVGSLPPRLETPQEQASPRPENLIVSEQNEGSLSDGTQYHKNSVGVIRGRAKGKGKAKASKKPSNPQNEANNKWPAESSKARQPYLPVSPNDAAVVQNPMSADQTGLPYQPGFQLQPGQASDMPTSSQRQPQLTGSAPPTHGPLPGQWPRDTSPAHNGGISNNTANRLPEDQPGPSRPPPALRHMGRGNALPIIPSTGPQSLQPPAGVQRPGLNRAQSALVPYPSQQNNGYNVTHIIPSSPALVSQLIHSTDAAIVDPPLPDNVPSPSREPHEGRGAPNIPRDDLGDLHVDEPELTPYIPGRKEPQIGKRGSRAKGRGKGKNR